MYDAVDAWAPNFRHHNSYPIDIHIAIHIILREATACAAGALWLWGRTDVKCGDIKWPVQCLITWLKIIAGVCVYGLTGLFFLSHIIAMRRLGIKRVSSCRRWDWERHSCMGMLCWKTIVQNISVYISWKWFLHVSHLDCSSLFCWCCPALDRLLTLFNYSIHVLFRQRQ